MPLSTKDQARQNALDIKIRTIEREIEGYKAILSFAERLVNKEYINSNVRLLAYETEASELRKKSDASSAAQGRMSYGLATQGSENSAQQLMESIENIINSAQGSFHIGMEKCSASTEINFKTIPMLTVADLDRLELVPNGSKLKKCRVILSGRNENELQSVLSSNADELCAIDTHSSSSWATEFMHPRTFGKPGTCCSDTAKADMTSINRRLVFEVKSPENLNELLLQIIARVRTSMDMSHILHDSIAFGALPDVAYVFIGKRVIPTQRCDSNVTHFHLFQVQYKDVFRMWMTLSKQLVNPLTKDGALVFHGLRLLGLNPWLCRVKLNDWSQHNVYQIHLPRDVSWPNNLHAANDEEIPEASRTCVAINCDCPDFAMKVIGDTESYEKEVGSLRLVKPAYFLCGRKYSDTKELVAAVGGSNISNSKKTAGWADREEALKPTSGGVIIMKLGQPIPNYITTDLQRQIYEDCELSLSAIHSHDLCHTDVRLPNILKFADDMRYALIDFGDVVKRGSKVNLTKFSEGRRKLLVSKNSDEIVWNEVDDFKMLARAVFFHNNTNQDESDNYCSQEIMTDNQALLNSFVDELPADIVAEGQKKKSFKKELIIFSEKNRKPQALDNLAVVVEQIENVSLGVSTRSAMTAKLMKLQSRDVASLEMTFANEKKNQIKK